MGNGTGQRRPIREREGEARSQCRQGKKNKIQMAERQKKKENREGPEQGTVVRESVTKQQLGKA